MITPTECTCAPARDWREEGPQQPDEDCPAHGNPAVLASPSAPADPTDGLTLQQADDLWDAVAIPGPKQPTFAEQYERVCRRVAEMLRLATAEREEVNDDPAPAEQRATETDEERADREETERDHARGDHTYCGITCEVEMPTDHLRNFVIAKGYPGTKGALDELLRRAHADAPAVSAYKAAQDRVTTLHAPVQHLGQAWCSECSVRRSTGPRTDEWVAFIPHPCPTLEAINSSQEA